MQRPSFSLQLPSSLQRAEPRQSAFVTAAHTPSFELHWPSRSHALDFLQSASVATQRPSFAAQAAASLHALEAAQSSFEEAMHLPDSAVQRPERAQTLSGSGVASMVPAQWRRESALHFPALSTQAPSS